MRFHRRTGLWPSGPFLAPKMPSPEGAVDSNGNSIAGTSATQYGVYIAYMGAFTDEQVAENALKHQERSDRVKAARAAAEAKAAANGTATTESTEPETPGSAQTAKERVAAARTAQKAS